MYSEAYFDGLEEVLGAEGMGMAATILGVMMIVYVLLFIVAILNYVFVSLSLYTVGKRRGLKLYGMAWVPFGQNWLLGCIADQYDRKAKGKDKKLGKFLLIGSIVAVSVAILVLVVTMVSSISMISAEMMGGIATGGIAALVISMIVILLVYIFLIVWLVFYYIALFKYFKSCSPRNAVWMLVLSIVIGSLFTSISMLCVRKKDGGFEALQQEEPAEEALEEPAEMPALNEPEEE